MKGQFYPSNSAEIEKFITKCVDATSSKIHAKGVILPHAGYIYSGGVAAQTMSRVIPKKKLIILGPNHSGFGEFFSVYPGGLWRTPMGDIEVDSELVAGIIERGTEIKKDSLAHKFEHSIEVELPIIKYFFDEFTIVPIVCATASWDVYKKVGQQIFEGIKEVRGDVLVIASGDMTHYEPEAQARKKDSLAIESIVKLDEEELIARVKEKNISMCGVATIPIMLIVTKLMGATKAEVVKYQTSGDITGDYSAVVGYLGAIIN